MTDGQLDGRTQRCEERKGKALSNGVRSDAIHAGAASGRAQARRSGMRRHHGVYVRPRRSGRIGDENAPLPKSGTNLKSTHPAALHGLTRGLTR